MIQKTKSSSSEPHPYPSPGNFTSTPAAYRHLECQLRRCLVALSLLLLASPALGVEEAGRFFTRRLTLRCGVGSSCSPPPGGGGLRTFVLHQGYPYPENLQG